MAAVNGDIWDIK